MNIKLFKQKDFILLMIGKITSLLGSNLQSFALSLYVLKLTGSATKFASMLAIMMVPKLILGPISGVFVDRYDRKKILVYADLLSFITTLIFGIIYLSKGNLSLIDVYILSITLSLISTLSEPAVGTVLPSIIEKENLVDANGLNSLLQNLIGLLSPVLAGAIFGLYGLGLIFIINSLSFFISAISEIFINIPKLNRKISKFSISEFNKDLIEGLKFIISKKLIYTLLLLVLMLNFAFSPLFSVGLVYISKQVLKITDVQYGMISGLLVAAMMLSPFIASKFSKSVPLPKMIFINMSLIGILILLMSIVPIPQFQNLFTSNVIPAVALTIITMLIAIIAGVANISLSSMAQQEVPLELMGRVFTTISTIAMAAIPLGQLIFGFLYDKIPSYLCVFISSLLIFIPLLLFKKVLLNFSKEENIDESFNISKEEVAYSIKNDIEN